MSQANYLKEIADAIREKEESTSPIFANDFANRIKNISSESNIKNLKYI